MADAGGVDHRARILKSDGIQLILNALRKCVHHHGTAAHSLIAFSPAAC